MRCPAPPGTRSPLPRYLFPGLDSVTPILGEELCPERGRRRCHGQGDEGRMEEAARRGRRAAAGGRPPPGTDHEARHLTQSGELGRAIRPFTSRPSPTACESSARTTCCKLNDSRHDHLQAPGSAGRRPAGVGKGVANQPGVSSNQAGTVSFTARPSVTASPPPDLFHSA